MEKKGRKRETRLKTALQFDAVVPERLHSSNLVLSPLIHPL